MNYVKLHNDFIDYCKRTTPRERLLKRRADDFRLADDYLYIERHHIIPKHEGGTNDPDNLIELLP